MRPSTALLALALPLVAPAVAGVNDIVIDLGRGPVTVHVPDAYDGTEAAPLILLLHGYTSDGAATEAYANFKALVDVYGFCYAYPDGTKDPLGYRFWNATDACCNLFGSSVDDSGYLQALIDAVKAQIVIDGRRVFIVGHSNGGFMGYRMACDHADTIAAVASLAGATFKDETQCSPSVPVDVLQIHGTSDGTIAYGGGSILGNEYPGAVETVTTWATYDGCTLVVDNSQPDLDLVADIPGAETKVARYVDGCAEGGSAELWTMQGADHVPAITAQFTTLVVEWLYAHPKPGLDATRYCSPNVANSTGSPSVLQADGSDAIDQNDLTLIAEMLPPNQFGYFLASLTPGFVANPGGSAGNLCVGGEIARFVKQVGNSGVLGTFAAAIDLTKIPTSPETAIQTGETWHFQAWHRDGTTSNFTDALAILFR